MFAKCCCLFPRLWESILLKWENQTHRARQLHAPLVCKHPTRGRGLCCRPGGGRVEWSPLLKCWQHITGLVAVTDGALCRTDGFSAFGKKGKVLDVPWWERRGDPPGIWEGREEGTFCTSWCTWNLATSLWQTCWECVSTAFYERAK